MRQMVDNARAGGSIRVSPRDPSVGRARKTRQHDRNPEPPSPPPRRRVWACAGLLNEKLVFSGEADDETVPGQLVPVRRQCAVRRGALRALPRQPGLRTREVARLFRPDAAGPGGRWLAGFARRRARSDRRIVRAARQGQRLCSESGVERPVRRTQAGPCPVDHRGLSVPRQPLGEPRSAAAAGTSGHSRTGAGVLRPDRSRHGHRCSPRRTRISGRRT